MSYTAFSGLIANATLLLSLGLIYDFVSEKKVVKGKKSPYFIGILIGLLGIIVMMNPWRLSSDVVFDTRSILLSLCGLFFGFIPAVTAGIMTSIYRIYSSGLGVYAGIATISTSVLIGLLWRVFAKGRLSSISMQELYLFGIIVHIDMLFCMLLLPPEAKSSFYSDISLPVMIIYPFASMFLGKLLSRQKERAEQKQHIEEEKEFLAVTLKSIGDAVIATDINGKITLMNKISKELTGWTDNSANGKYLEEVFNIINENTKEKCENPVTRVLNSGKTVELANHTVLISKSGRQYIIEDSASPICDKNGKTIGVVLVFRDMTEKNKLSEKIRNSEKLESLGTLAGGIAHDFNNLLSGIYGNIELALAQSESENVKNYLEKAMDVFSRAKELTKQLLTFSKGGAPEIKIANIVPVIKKSAVFALSGSKSSHEFCFPDNLWSGFFDSSQIGDVIHNLVLNAAQSMPDGGKVLLTAQNIEIDEKSLIKLEKGKYIKVSVIDTGTGITKENMLKIFDPFFTTKIKGTGLGLPTAFSILQKHNGTIDVESTPGNGSIFSIFIPSSGKTVEFENDNQEVKHKISGEGEKILIMDDEIYVREVLGSMLEQLNFSVEKTIDGTDALKKLTAMNNKNEKYYAVFFDLTVQGGMGGAEAVKKLREFDQETFVIAASGYSDDEVIVCPEKFGFNDSIKKPFNFSVLVEILNKCKKK